MHGLRKFEDSEKAKGCIKVLQTLVPDAGNLIKVKVMVPVNIQEPNTMVSDSVRPYLKDRFVRVIETTAKYISGSKAVYV